MAEIDQLRRGYRRLLWAYPNWYRRERGLEMLTTLLDAAKPGQYRPTGRDVMNMTVQGILCRLRLPRGSAPLIIVVVVAWFAAVAGAAAAGHLTTALLAPPPTEGEAIAIAEAATAQRPHNIAGPAFRCPDYCNYAWDRHDDQVMTFDEPTYRNNGLDHTMVVYWPRGRDHAAAIEAARARLVGQGWTIDTNAHLPQPIDSPPVLGFIANNGNLSVVVSTKLVPGSGDGYPGGVPDDFPISLTFERHPPPVPLTAAVAAVAAASLLSGWMIAAWTLHRGRRHAAGHKTTIVLLCTPPLAVMGLTDCLTLPLIVVSALNSVPVGLIPAAATDVLSLLTSRPGPAGMVAAAAIAAVLTIAVAALPTRGFPNQYRTPA